MIIKSALKTDWFFLLLIISLAIFFRSLNFSESFNFSSDQAKFSIKSLEILRGETAGLLLIGPPISLQLEGKEISQGGVIYYFQALFLYLGNSDPVKSSYLFMLFASFMAVPLFFGVKFLVNTDKAKLITILYCLTPLYVNYTKFLWNPNFQLSLTPLLFLFLGLHKIRNKSRWLFFAGIWFGIIFQFHYQLFIGGLFLIVWLKIYFKNSFSKIILFLLGSIIGFFPIIIYEFKNNFINLNTLFFYLQNFQSFTKTNSGYGFLNNQHYFLSLILITLVIVTPYFKKLNSKIIYALGLLLIIADLFRFTPKPTGAFGMSENWNYQKEQQVFEIIKKENLKKYNLTNLNYDTLALVQKYLHKKENISENLTDYWETQQLFVIAPNSKDIQSDPTYEIQVVKPFTIVKTWPIGNNHSLYLLKKS